MPESTTTPQAPRIAIKFGASASNGSKPTQSAKKLPPPSSLGKRPRSHALNHDSDSDDEEERFGRHEAVTTIGDNFVGKDGRSRDAKAARTDQKSLVIACQSDGGWKAAAKAQRGAQQEKETEIPDHEKDIKWGLTVTKRSKAEDQTGVEGKKDTPESKAATIDEEEDQTSSSKTADQDAMDALLGNDTKKKKQLTISDANTEQGQFRAAVQAAGEVSTIEEYDQIPDGEFGMAMLRGMGYDESKKSAQPKEVRRRPALLGLGAKEDEEIKKADLAKKHGYRDRPPRLSEYRRGEDTKRQQQEERYSSSYKQEREREKLGSGSSRRYDDRDRDRDRNRDRDRERHRDRDGSSYRHRERHSRF